MADDDQVTGNENDAGDEPRPMSQDEINSLFKQLQDETPEVGSEDAAITEELAAVAETKTDGPLGQDDIDALLQDMSGDAEPVAEPSGPLGQDDIDALLQSMSGEVEPEVVENAPAAAEPSGPLGQDDIDALLQSMSGEAEPEAVEDASVVTEPEPSGPLGQDDIDALLQNMSGESDSEAAIVEDTPVAAEPDPSGPLGQDDIDSLLAQMQGGEPEPAIAATSNDNVAMGQDDIDDLINQLSGNEEVAATPSSAAETVVADGNAALGQDDIDDLLAQLGGGAAVAETSTDSGSEVAGQDDIDALLQEMGMVDAGGATTNLLSTEQIAGIVDGQGDQEFDDNGDSDEEMISQGDIDSLVREMSRATGVPDQEEIDARVAENESDIEALLQEAAEPMASSDAVQGSILLGQQQAMMATSYAAVDPSAVMTPGELRGTRLLLVAAVMLLAMCAVTMAFIVSSVNDLSNELEKNRTSEAKPVDDFQENISYARKMLGAEDALEVGRGLTFVKRLKENHDNEPDKIIIISLLLADHYRGTGAYSKARDEYELMTERQGTLYEDPQHYIDYSETLFALGEKKYNEAITVLYRLMANEQYYVSKNDIQGNARDVEILARHEKILQEAYLMLGRIYTAQLDGGDSQSGAMQKQSGAAQKQRGS